MYGFALICWAALKMDIPFRGYNDIMLFDGVIHEGANGDRPRLENEWPDELQRMIESGKKENPSMYLICISLLRKCYFVFLKKQGGRIILAHDLK